MLLSLQRITDAWNEYTVFYEEGWKMADERRAAKNK